MDEKKLENSIKEKLKNYPTALKIFNLLCKDKEANELLELGNTVSIKRMGFNDHGRIHTKIAVDSSLKIFALLGDKTSLVKEKIGTTDDSLTAIVLAAFLHDVGMSLNRKDHEILGVILATPIIGRLLEGIDNRGKIIPTACEGILCHMANYKPTSIEAGIVSISDGTDMTAGRARIPHYFGKVEKKKGRIHAYSALSVMNVDIKKGKKKPVLIEVLMNNPAGVFQIEETLMPKLMNSGLADKIEVTAVIKNKDKKEIVEIH